MFYIFHQNNNYGKYLLPAREVAIEADTYEGALEKMSLIPGVYFSDKSDKECACCAPRWSKEGYEYSAEEFAIYIDERDDFMVWRSPKVPMMYIQYADGTVKIVNVETPVQASDVPVDAPVPMPVQESAQECAAPIEDEVKNDLVVPVDSNTWHYTMWPYVALCWVGERDKVATGSRTSRDNDILQYMVTYGHGKR